MERSRWLFALVGCWACQRPTHPLAWGSRETWGTPSAPAFVRRLLSQLGGKSGSSAASPGAALKAAPHPRAANPAGLLSTEARAATERGAAESPAIMMPCSGCQGLGAGQAPSARAPGPMSLPGCG